MRVYNELYTSDSQRVDDCRFLPRIKMRSRCALWCQEASSLQAAANRYIFSRSFVYSSLVNGLTIFIRKIHLYVPDKCLSAIKKTSVSMLHKQETLRPKSWRYKPKLRTDLAYRYGYSDVAFLCIRTSEPLSLVTVLQLAKWVHTLDESDWPRHKLKL